ncbi:O-antigen ligase family protein [Granulicella sp. 5B5]|uniref:O-antigen ligase family protein n=1 Tax=Granulicella sp. 5B5 TaxID=1617967 RepID=UPI0015F47F70|nr:O-antigen ligase family protein [Granulicella sp. 5B5]
MMIVSQSDAHQDDRVTASLPLVVGFFFAFRLLIVLLSVRLFGADPQVGVVASFTINIGLLLLVLLLSSDRPMVRIGELARLVSVRWALAFLLFSACSLLWTVAESKAAAIGYWTAMASDVAIVFLLLRRDRTPCVVNSLLKGFVYGACIVAVIAWLMPTQSDLRLGDEELLGPNQIGYLCAFAFFMAQYLQRRKQGSWYMASLLLAVTLLRTFSKTTIAALLAAGVVLLLKDKAMSRRTKIWIIVITLVVIAAFSTIILSYASVYASEGNQSETLSGRFSIWAIIFVEAIQQPWIGHGFHSVWQVIPPIGPDKFEARHAHNELLQQFYAYGAAGIVLLTGVYGSFYRQVRKLPPGSMRVFFCSLLLFVIVRGLADTEAFDLSLPLWAIILFSASIEGMIQDRAQYRIRGLIAHPRADTMGASSIVMGS